ncbi:MAG TPA: extracellular solute-binding protein [Usitatibacter sp.]|nr:extracellular solute-binding protein [Usitatibacter sp.]
MVRTRSLLLAFFAGLALASAALAVEPSPEVAAVAALRGPGRTAKLVAGAKKEGELMVYSSLTPGDQIKLAEDFKARYGVTIRFWRGSQSNIISRVMSETRGGRYLFDAIETNAPQIEAISREGLLQDMGSPYIDQELIPETVPPHHEWAPDRLNMVVFAYNTAAIQREDLPRSWAHLLDPQWKGRIGLESTNVEWFETVVEAMGEKAGLDFFRRLGESGVAVRTGHTHSTGLVIAGEIPLMIGVFSHDVDRMKPKNAPIDWFVLPPAVILPSAVGVSRRALHPHAAALFLDYMLTDGQRFYTEVYRVPANRAYDTPVRRLIQRGEAYRVVDARASMDEHDKWVKLYKRLIVDRSQH